MAIQSPSDAASVRSPAARAQAIDLDTGTLKSSTATIILFMTRLACRVDNYVQVSAPTVCLAPWERAFPPPDCRAAVAALAAGMMH